ncbi:hypothetical protein [Rhodospirillum sp. A1_3_36]|uniref:hypothetical protein n=1 Tax=Rhodospirillum sp. A1_3_36 TaxID=3391666 RepID=UPI0039A68482
MSTPWSGADVDASAPFSRIALSGASPCIDPIALQYRSRRLQSQAMARALTGLFRLIRRLVRGAAAPSPTTWAAP